MKNVAGSGAKWVDVSGARFPGWIASFAVRHGVPASAGPAGAPENSLIVTCDTHYVTFTAPDGAVAECHPPFPESLAWPARGDGPARVLMTPAAGRPRPGSPRPSPRTPRCPAPSACCSSGSAGTRPASSPGTRRRSRTPRPAPGWCTAAAPRAAGRSTASPGAGRSRPTRRSTPRRPRRSSSSAAGSRQRGRPAIRAPRRDGLAGGRGVLGGRQAGGRRTPR